MELVLRENVHRVPDLLLVGVCQTDAIQDVVCVPHLSQHIGRGPAIHHLDPKFRAEALQHLSVLRLLMARPEDALGKVIPRDDFERAILKAGGGLDDAQVPYLQNSKLQHELRVLPDLGLRLVPIRIRPAEVELAVAEGILGAWALTSDDALDSNRRQWNCSLRTYESL